MMLLLYVYDLFLIGADGMIVDTKRKLAVEFEIKDLGMMHYFLGMESGRMQMEYPWYKGSM